MATYNGESFVGQQIESLINQSEENWILIVADDGSKDNTVEIVREYSLKDNRIKLDNQVRKGKGACQSFSYLAQKGLDTQANFFFFCDQDDVWDRDKIKSQLKILRKHPRETPALVHHDLEVVNSSLTKIHSSFFKMMRLDPQNLTFGSLLGRNEVTGCTIGCNRALLFNATPIGKRAIMHDWWLALVCEALGDIYLINQPLLKYRQHDNNTVGAKSLWKGLNPFTNWFKGWKRGNLEFLTTIEQAKCLNSLLSNATDPNFLHSPTKTIIREYISILDYQPLQRIKMARQCGHIRTHWLLSILNIFRLLTMSKPT